MKSKTACCQPAITNIGVYEVCGAFALFLLTEGFDKFSLRTPQHALPQSFALNTKRHAHTRN